MPGIQKEELPCVIREAKSSTWMHSVFLYVHRLLEFAYTIVHSVEETLVWLWSTGFDELLHAQYMYALACLCLTQGSTGRSSV